MTDQPTITFMQKKIIKSLLYGNYEVLNTFFARIYTCTKDAEYWLYSGLEGALVYCIDIRAKTCKFLLFDLKSFEIVFDCELYKKFDKYYKKGSERFYYFEVNEGFIGFEIPNMNEAEIIQASILSFGDEYIKRKLKEFKPMKENELKEKAKTMTQKLEAKFHEEEHSQKMVRNEIVLKTGLLEKLINSVEINDETGKLIIKGPCNKGVDSELVKLKGLDLVFETEKKIGDAEVYSKYFGKNILRNYLKDILIPKRKINRGEGIIIGKSSDEDLPIASGKKRMSQQLEPPKPIVKPPAKKRQSEQIQPLTGLEFPKKEKKEKEKKATLPPPEPVPEVAEPEPTAPEPAPSEPTVTFVSSAPSGGPPPPPPPLIHIPTTAVQHKDSGPSKKATGPIDLAAELAAKKNKLTHVEVKEYKSPALKKEGEEESSSSGGPGGMMAMILAQKNAMKKVGGAGPTKTAPLPTAPKPVTTAPKPVTTAPKPVTTAPKPVTTAPKPAVENKPKPKFTPAPGGAKPPMKMGGGGFAAMQAMLAGRMAPQKKPEAEAPKKPIVELAKGSTCGKMDMSKLIGNLSKNMETANKKAEKQEAATVVFLDSGKPTAAPPPPPPPPF